MRPLAGNALSRWVESLNSSLEVLILRSLRRHYPNQVLGVDPRWILSATYSSPVELWLDAKRTTATAGAGRVRIAELETCSVQSFDVINLSPFHIKKTRLVDEHLQAIEFEDGIALVAKVLIETHAILKAGTTSSNHLNPQAGVGFGLLGKDLFDFLFCFLR